MSALPAFSMVTVCGLSMLVEPGAVREAQAWRIDEVFFQYAVIVGIGQYRRCRSLHRDPCLEHLYWSACYGNAFNVRARRWCFLQHAVVVGIGDI